MVGELVCITSIISCFCPEGHRIPWDTMGDDYLQVRASVHYSHCFIGGKFYAGVPAERYDIHSGAPAYREGLHAIPHLGGAPQSANDI